MDQYSNPSNPIAHYDQLAEEILYQTDDKIDAVVLGVGTGGTIAGVARKIKERIPNCILVGADPYGSVLAIPAELNTPAPPNKVEGIGYDFVPRTCCRESVDYWVKTDDKESFVTARDLVSKEGLLVGGSSGSVFWAAKQFIKDKGWQNDKTKRVVCIFQDSVRNYITKYLSKEWCIENRFISYDELKEEGHPLTGVPLSSFKFPTVEAVADLTVGEAK